MANPWTGALTGGISGGLAGAGTGAAIGSVLPGLGTGLGALIGGGLGAFGGGFGGYSNPSSLTGKDAQTQQFQKFNPNQLSALQQLLQQGMQNFNPDALEARARNKFQTQTVPSIAERFTSMGSGGLGSSAFANALGQSGADLEGQLAALRSQYGGQALNFGLQPQFESLYEPETGGLFGGLAQSSGPMLEQLLKLLTSHQNLQSFQGQNQLGGNNGSNPTA
jgi:hypothetical protein